MSAEAKGQVEIDLGNGNTLKCFPLVVSELQRPVNGDDRIDLSYVIPHGIPLKRYAVILAEVK